MTKERSRIAGLAVCCAVVLALGACPALATPLVEVTVETDKAVYDLGETCIITCTLYNPTDEWATVANDADMYAFENALGLPGADLLANGDALWHDEFAFRTVAPPLVVCPDCTRECDVYWDLSMDVGGWVGPGEYELVAVVWPLDGTLLDSTNASAHITVVPEPVTLALVVAGVGALIARRSEGVAYRRDS